MNNNGEEHLQQILRQVQQGSVAPFLGAGASHAAGGQGNALGFIKSHKMN